MALFHRGQNRGWEVMGLLHDLSQISSRRRGVYTSTPQRKLCFCSSNLDQLLMKFKTTLCIPAPIIIKSQEVTTGRTTFYFQGGDVHTKPEGQLGSAALDSSSSHTPPTQCTAESVGLVGSSGTLKQQDPWWPATVP